jgi:hypothetical protein
MRLVVVLALLTPSSSSAPFLLSACFNRDSAQFVIFSAKNVWTWQFRVHNVVGDIMAHLRRCVWPMDGQRVPLIRRKMRPVCFSGCPERLRRRPWNFWEAGELDSIPIAPSLALLADKVGGFEIYFSMYVYCIVAPIDVK